MTPEEIQDKLPERKINGYTYQLKRFPFTLGIKTMNEMMRILGPTFGGLFAGSRSLDEINLSEGMNYFIQNLEDDKILKLIKTFLEHMTRDSLKCIEFFDEWYAGEYDELLEALLWSINQNFFRKVDLMSRYDLLKKVIWRGLEKAQKEAEKMMKEEEKEEALAS